MLVLLFTYIFWGPALLIFPAMIVAAKGPLPVRVLWACGIALLLTLLCTPVMWGTEGFAMAVPLPWMLYDSEHSHFHAEWAGATFLFAFAVNLLFGERSRRYPPTAPGAPHDLVWGHVKTGSAQETAPWWPHRNGIMIRSLPR